MGTVPQFACWHSVAVPSPDHLGRFLLGRLALRQQDRVKEDGIIGWWTGRVDTTFHLPAPSGQSFLWRVCICLEARVRPDIEYCGIGTL